MLLSYAFLILTIKVNFIVQSIMQRINRYQVLTRIPTLTGVAETGEIGSRRLGI